jgi:hypothetical protein
MFDDHKRLICTTVLLVLAVCIPTTEAQEVAHSLDQLRQRVRVGDKVIVTDLQGRETQGSIAEISASSLGLIVGGARTDFSETDLGTVGRRDSRWNGTLWGLVVGAALGMSFEKGLANEYGRDDIGYGSVVLPLKAIVRGYSFVVTPISWRNRKFGVAKLKIKDMGSRYFFICAYVWLEKYFSRGDYRRK